MALSVYSPDPLAMQQPESEAQKALRLANGGTTTTTPIQGEPGGIVGPGGSPTPFDPPVTQPPVTTPKPPTTTPIQGEPGGIVGPAGSPTPAFTPPVQTLAPPPSTGGEQGGIVGPGGSPTPTPAPVQQLAPPPPLTPPPTGGISPIPPWVPSSGGTGPTGAPGYTVGDPMEIVNGMKGYRDSVDPIGISTGIGTDGAGVKIADYVAPYQVFYGNDVNAAANAAMAAYSSADQSAQQQQQLALNNYAQSNTLGNLATADQVQVQQNLTNQIGTSAGLMGASGLQGSLSGQVAYDQGIANMRAGYYQGQGVNAGNALTQNNADLAAANHNFGAVGSGALVGAQAQAANANQAATIYGQSANNDQALANASRTQSLSALGQLQALGGQLGTAQGNLGASATRIGDLNQSYSTQQMNAANALGSQGLALGTQQAAAANALGLQGVNVSNDRAAAANQIGTQGLNYALGQGANAQQMAQQGFQYGMTQGNAAQQQGAAGMAYGVGQANALNAQSSPYAQSALSSMGQSDADRAATQQALARMQSFLDQGPGPSQAEALLKQQSDATMAQNIALANSGRGAGDNVLAQRQALFANAAQQQKLGQDMSALRANEAATWRGQQLEGLGALQQGAGALRTQDLGAAQQASNIQLGLGGLGQQYAALGLGNQAQMAGVAQQFGQTGLQAQAQLAGLGQQYAALGQGTQLSAAQLAQQYSGQGLTNQTQLAGLAQQYNALGLGQQATMGGLAQQYAQGGLNNQAQMYGVGQQYQQAGVGAQSALSQAAAQGYQATQAADLGAIGQASGAQLGQNQLAQQYLNLGLGTQAQYAGLQNQTMQQQGGQSQAALNAYLQATLGQGQLSQGLGSLNANIGTTLSGQQLQSQQAQAQLEAQLVQQNQGQQLALNQATMAGLGAAQGQRAQGQQLSNEILNQQLNAGLQQNSLQAQMEQQSNIANAQLMSHQAINSAQIASQENIASQQASAQNLAAGVAAGGMLLAAASDIRGKTDIKPASYDDYLKSNLKTDPWSQQNMGQQPDPFGLNARGPQNPNMFGEENAFDPRQLNAMRQFSSLAQHPNITGRASSDVRAKTDVQPQSFDDYLAGGSSSTPPGAPLGQPSPAVAPPPMPSQGQQAPAYDFRPARGYSYQYKNPNAPGAAPGQQYGPMAQDLEKTAAGANAVGTDPNGMKFVDPGRVALATAAGLGEQQRRMDRHEQALSQMHGFLSQFGGRDS